MQNQKNTIQQNALRIFYYPDSDTLRKIMVREEKRMPRQTEQTVKRIIGRVRAEGDGAVADYIRKFDCPGMEDGRIKVTEQEWAAACQKTPVPLRKALRRAASNIRKFHKAQKIKDITVETLPGVTCMQKSIPIDKVGLYIPGGTAPLVSTVLMLAIPAKLAGCREIILCSPPGPDGEIAPEILFAARLCGVTSVYRAGGAAAIAAMAYGTETIPAVNKIFGPGNDYVTAAKQIVSVSRCAIDIPAGPSEVMILADESAEPAYICADFLSQLEHGRNSQAILLTVSGEIAEKTAGELGRQAALLSRQDFINRSLENSRIVVLRTEEEMTAAADLYAPEHLIICTRDCRRTAERIRNAGSIFLGNFTPESAGDYASGTNHTLPTGGWAVSRGGVNLSSFLKRITMQEITREGLENLSGTIRAMALAEGLDAHSRAVSVRLDEPGARK